MKTLRLFILAVLLGGFVVTVQAQDVASDLLARINGLRASLGLPGYTYNGILGAAAANQAQWMANTGQISHTQNDGSTPSSRAAAAGYAGAWVSENIYIGSHAGVGDAWNFWLNSPIHYRGMTNPNYQEIGIASATGSGGRSFVLVFGSPGGSTYVPPNRSGGTSSAASGPPPYVVGLDNYGNIMHEVQPEQTIGDILLIYGYTWEDMQEFMALNAKTDADIRRLQIGEVVLVPPYEGTYTPTPYPEGWPTNTPEADAFIATAIAEAAAEATESAAAAAITPTATPTERPRLRQTERALQTQAAASPLPISTSADIPALLDLTHTLTLTPTPPIGTASDEILGVLTLEASPTPDISPSQTPMMTAIASLNVNDSAPSAPLQEVVAVTPQGESPWLVIALVVQAVIIVVGGVMFVRGLRRR